MFSSSVEILSDDTRLRRGHLLIFRQGPWAEIHVNPADLVARVDKAETGIS
jgi:hypothetical protein